MSARRPLLLVGAAGVLVSAYMHFYLYFWGGYRGINIDRVLGIDISRSFALNAVAGLVVAEILVLSLRYERLAIPGAVIGIAFALGALGAYVLARTSGILGFTETGWSTEAVISTTAEVIAALALGGHLVTRVTAARDAPEPTPAAGDWGGICVSPAGNGNTDPTINPRAPSRIHQSAGGRSGPDRGSLLRSDNPDSQPRPQRRGRGSPNGVTHGRLARR